MLTSSFRAAVWVAATATGLGLMTGCYIDAIHMPAWVQAGDSFTATLKVSSKALDSEWRTPISCVATPVDWTVDAPTYSGTVAGTPVAGDGVSQPAFEGIMQANYPEPQHEWHCWTFPLAPYEKSDTGQVTYTITPPATETGRHVLRFGTGTSQEDNAADSDMGARAITVGAAPDPLDDWDFAREGVLNDDLRDVTYGAGGWVAVGDQGLRSHSLDGVTWTDGVIDPSTDWVDVAYANGVYVAVGANETLQSSTDGLVWTPVDIGPVAAVAAGDGRLIAVGGDQVMSSTDGINWQIKAFAAVPDLGAVAFGDGRWLALGRGTKNQVLSSPDGVQWSQEANFGEQPWFYLLFAGGRFIASGANGGGQWAHSTVDGNGWVEVADVFPREPRSAGPTVAADLVFGPHGMVMSTTDGTNFVERGSLTRWMLFGSHSEGGRVVAVGESGLIVTSDLMGAPTFDGLCEAPTGDVGELYGYDLAWTAGAGVHTWEIASGVLPAGLDMVDGVVAGTPTQAGQFDFDIRVTSGLGTFATAECSLTIDGDEPDLAEDTGLPDLRDTDEWDDTDEGEGSEQCGCSELGGAAGGGLWIAALMVLMRRRR